MQAGDGQVVDDAGLDRRGGPELEGPHGVELAPLHHSLGAARGAAELVGALPEQPAELPVGLPGIGGEAAGHLDLPHGLVPVAGRSTQAAGGLVGGTEGQVDRGGLRRDPHRLVEVALGWLETVEADQARAGHDQGAGGGRVVVEDAARLGERLVEPDFTAIVEPRLREAMPRIVEAGGRVVGGAVEPLLQAADRPVELVVWEQGHGGEA